MQIDIDKCATWARTFFPHLTLQCGIEAVVSILIARAEHQALKHSYLA